MQLRERAGHVFNRLRYGMPDRYGHLTKTIVERGCRSIVEIGVWDAEHSRQMIQAALQKSRPEQVRFYGFDLFEAASDDLLESEVSKSVRTLDEARRKLAPFEALGVTVELHQGNTMEVLPRVVPTMPPADFVFVDGGHSYETVRSDWENVSELMHERSVVIFDDYVNELALRQENYGVNRLIDELDRQRYRVSRLRPIDRFAKPWGPLEIAFVQVTLRPA